MKSQYGIVTFSQPGTDRSASSKTFRYVRCHGL